jgi:hypothetical protein
MGDDLPKRVARRYRQANDQAALEAMAGYWADVFLDQFVGAVDLGPAHVESILAENGLSADVVNEADPTTKTAGAFEWVQALGGKILKGTLHLLLGPFFGIKKFITSPAFRAEVKTGFMRALDHEKRSTIHMLSVASRLAHGEDVNPQERKAAMVQLVDILSKVVLAVLVGPHIVALFQGGIWKVLAAAMSPLDDIVFILFDKPIRVAARKLLGADIGMLPSGFYTHFASV